MLDMKKLSQLFILMMLSISCFANSIYPADTKFESYLPLLKNKRVAIFTNNASQIDNKNIIEVLQSKHINITAIFTPEHGLTVMADAGDKVANSTYNGIPVVSLYGKKTAPTTTDLKNIDLVIYDVQDVGVRYYTYTSSLQRLMEATISNDKPLIILDRPNPNAHYIDGPILDKKYKSFVGLQPVPIVYGMTIGEYANMLLGEKWLEMQDKTNTSAPVIIITMDNYTHNAIYNPTTKPSPNLPNLTAIYWYPSRGWYEGTQLGVGRGTPMPFQILGAPAYESISAFSFIPIAMAGANNPPLKNQTCYGWNLQMSPESAYQQINSKINLNLLITAYTQYPDKNKFFTSFFDKLAGNDKLRQQIINGESESQIRASWQHGLNQFKLIRQKYLLYP